MVWVSMEMTLIAHYVVSALADALHVLGISDITGKMMSSDARVHIL